jgi:hypothetical protein
MNGGIKVQLQQQAVSNGCAEGERTSVGHRVNLRVDVTQKTSQLVLRGASCRCCWRERARIELELELSKPLSAKKCEPLSRDILSAQHRRRASNRHECNHNLNHNHNHIYPTATSRFLALCSRLW